MSPCVFCNRHALEVIAEDELAFAIRDKFPLRPLHTLILPKRHEADGLSLSIEEKAAVVDLAKQIRIQIFEKDDVVDGFNFGLNSVPASGRKVPHAHFHLIPRRISEAPPPAAQA